MAAVAALGSVAAARRVVVRGLAVAAQNEVRSATGWDTLTATMAASATTMRRGQRAPRYIVGCLLARVHAYLRGAAAA